MVKSQKQRGKKGKAGIIGILSKNCGHCKNQKPILKKLQKEGYNIKIEDASNSKTLRTLQKAGKDVRGVPALVMTCDNKKIVGKIEGVTSEKDLKKMLEQLENGSCSV